MEWFFYLPLNLITVVAEKHEIDPKLVASIVYIESSGDARATRFEPNWRYFENTKEISKNLKITYETERQQQATSFGLMQVMGTVARELGFKGHLISLTKPSIGLTFGCKKLKYLLDKYSKLEDAISAYNAGSPRIVDGKYSNQSYVNKVMSKYLELKRISI